MQRPSLREPDFAIVGTDADNQGANVSARKSKKNAPAAGESENQRPKRKIGKLIRLDDLIPKQDVTGGHQLLFGVTDKTQSTNNPTKDK